MCGILKTDEATKPLFIHFIFYAFEFQLFAKIEEGTLMDTPEVSYFSSQVKPTVLESTSFEASAATLLNQSVMG